MSRITWDYILYCFVGLAFILAEYILSIVLLTVADFPFVLAIYIVFFIILAKLPRGIVRLNGTAKDAIILTIFFYFYFSSMILQSVISEQPFGVAVVMQTPAGISAESHVAGYRVSSGRLANPPIFAKRLSGRSKGSTLYFAPIVAQDWQREQPVSMVAAIRMSGDDQSESAARSILNRSGNEYIKYFGLRRSNNLAAVEDVAKTIGLNLVHPVAVLAPVESIETAQSQEQLKILIIIFASALLFCILCLYLAVKENKNNQKKTDTAFF